MLELGEILFHVRLNRSPPIGTRVTIALLAGLVAMAITAPVVGYLWGRPEPVAAIEDVLLRVQIERAPWARWAGLTGLGMAVAVAFELLAAAGERLVGEPRVLFNEITSVDAVAYVVVVTLVFGVGLAALHVIPTGDPTDPSVGTVYRRWFLVSASFVAVCVWAILVWYEVLGLTGVL